MVITKALALWLFIVGVVWAFDVAWMVMTGFTVRSVSLPMFLIVYFAGPFIMIIGSTLVMAQWHSRLGTFLIIAACAWLTWSIAPDYIDPPLNPRPYFILGIIAALVLAADAAALVLFRRIAKASNQALERL